MQTFSRRNSMPWKEWSLMLVRREFVELAIQPEANVKQLCGRFGISRKTGYKWLKRYREAKELGLRDRSRRPRQSPQRSSVEVEAKVLALRDANSAWGARTIRPRREVLGHQEVPASSTIHAILRRHQRIDPKESSKHRPFQRFEREAPNQLWQMDFKGHFALGNGQRCHPLGMVDDHSRFALCLQACRNQQGETVQQQLTTTFRRYGLPEAMLMDNGSPWGSSDPDHPYNAADGLAVAIGSRDRPWAAVPSPDSRQAGTVPPHPESRGADRARLEGFPPGASPVRSMARGLQPRATTQGTGNSITSQT